MVATATWLAYGPSSCVHTLVHMGSTYDHHKSGVCWPSKEVYVCIYVHSASLKMWWWNGRHKIGVREARTSEFTPGHQLLVSLTARLASFSNIYSRQKLNCLAHTYSTHPLCSYNTKNYKRVWMAWSHHPPPTRRLFFLIVLMHNNFSPLYLRKRRALWAHCICNHGGNLPP